MLTKRLRLRERTPELRKKLLTLSLEEQLKFIGFGEDRLKIELKRIEKGFSNFRMEYKMWDLILLENDEVIGDCGYHTWYTNHRRAEVGYGLKEEFRQKGFMYEALSKILEYGFQEMNLSRVEAYLSPDNKASKGLVEKCGFTQEGLLRGHYNNEDTFSDSFVYGLLKSDSLAS